MSFTGLNSTAMSPDWVKWLVWLQCYCVVQDFLDNSSSQLTYHGLASLREGLRPNELAVFFRNNHFNTIFLHKGVVHILVTDQGYEFEKVSYSQQPQCKETCNLNARKPASNYISRWLMSCFGVDTDHCCLHAGCAAVCRIYIMGLSVCLAPSCSMCLAPSRSMCLAPSRSVWVKELSCQKWNQFSQGHYVCRMLCGRSWMT